MRLAFRTRNAASVSPFSTHLLAPCILLMSPFKRPAPWSINVVGDLRLIPLQSVMRQSLCHSLQDACIWLKCGTCTPSFSDSDERCCICSRSDAAGQITTTRCASKNFTREPHSCLAGLAHCHRHGRAPRGWRALTTKRITHPSSFITSSAYEAHDCTGLV